LIESFFKGVSSVNENRPIVGITMGDPVGIGPELICRALSHQEVYDVARPLVIGDVRILEGAKQTTRTAQILSAVNVPYAGTFKPGCMDVLNVSSLDPMKTAWAHPTQTTGKAMIAYIEHAVDMALRDEISAMVTCPINKAALKMAGSSYPGHTELVAERTGARKYAMMMAGSKLKVVLVTIHIPLKNVPTSLSVEKIMTTIELTDDALKERFGMQKPKIAVTGLNPHSGEQGMFGDEEARLIQPAVLRCREMGMDVSGPYPSDTIFYMAMNRSYDAIVCMYHDQGLIPFKLIHFTDGVNTTLGLPIIRTSVDHGTAYDIAGQGVADPGSLIEAIKLAASQAVFRMESQKRLA
jgi:4-hydroxythreonine-4-phosphate dehydrogenase